MCNYLLTLTFNLFDMAYVVATFFVTIFALRILLLENCMNLKIRQKYQKKNVS